MMRTTTPADRDPLEGSKPAHALPNQLPADSAEDDAASGPSRVGLTPDLAEFRVPQVLKIFGSVIAPTTLLTSLLIYFGRNHVYWFFYHFGVDASLFSLTSEDYLRRSIDVLFVPLTVVTSAGLLVLWGIAMARTRITAESQAQLLRFLIPGMALCGLALFAIGIAGIFYRTAFEFHLAVSPLSLASGVLLVAYASRLRRGATALRERPGTHNPTSGVSAVVEAAGVFLLVALSLFWAATNYAAAVGNSRARQFEAELASYPSAVVYSTNSLSLQAPGVREVRCRDSEASYRFRYEGLKLVLRSGDYYLFLPEAWSAAKGVALLIPQNDSVRLEFIPAYADSAVPPSC